MTEVVNLTGSEEKRKVWFEFWGDASHQRAESKLLELNDIFGDYFEIWNTLDVEQYIYADWIIVRD